MELLLLRDRPNLENGFTFGKLSVNKANFCETIEDEERTQKKYGETAIPTGRYKVVLTMSNRFKTILPLLVDVPNFKGIRIHPGNTVDDTEGCIIVGRVRGKLGDKPAVLNSKIIFGRLMELLKKAQIDKEEVWITIR